MQIVSSVLFILLLAIGFGIFARNAKKIYRNIKLGREENRSDRKEERLKNMLMVAFGQSKMVKRPFAAVLHLFVYVGFVIINIEMIEIIIDGIFGTHRFLSFMGGFYDALIAIFEVLALLVIVAVTIFWMRRNITKVKRLDQSELDGWPRKDANTILYIEAVLMVFFLFMNAADLVYQTKSGGEIYGSFPVSQFLSPLFEGLSAGQAHIFERIFWWAHIIGVMAFMNYLYYSKHLHILLAFPNTYYYNPDPMGKFKNLEAVTKEVQLMMDPNADPFAAPEAGTAEEIPSKFGASDVQDLSWIQLLNAYSCTECGRCTAACPANITGKKLSPRLIMMKTRDRMEEVGRNIDANKGTFVEDGKSLLNDYITPEELWACTTCNACVEECPININPLSIIMDMRQYLVMEQSAAPMELNTMMTNIENNGAPWQYNQMDRLNWKDEN